MDAHTQKPREKHSRFVCPYCFNELDEGFDACCGEAGHGEWMKLCGMCDDVIPPEEGVQKIDQGHRYWVCEECRGSL